LTRGRRTALARQQTLRATMDWSYDFLPEVEKMVLRRLAVFRGDFTLEAAARVVGDENIGSFAVIEIVANLSQHSPPKKLTGLRGPSSPEGVLLPVRLGSPVSERGEAVAQ
jgi:hypothetical protein